MLRFHYRWWKAEQKWKRSMRHSRAPMATSSDKWHHQRKELIQKINWENIKFLTIWMNGFKSTKIDIYRKRWLRTWYWKQQSRWRHWFRYNPIVNDVTIEIFKVSFLVLHSFARKRKRGLNSEDYFSYKNTNDGCCQLRCRRSS